MSSSTVSANREANDGLRARKPSEKDVGGMPQLAKEREDDAETIKGDSDTVLGRTPDGTGEET